MSGRRSSSLRAFVWWLPLMAILVLLGAAEAIVRHGLILAIVIVLLPVAAYALGRRQGSRRTARHTLAPPDELARLRGLVADLESAAGRPAAAILASYRHIQQRYGGRS